MGFYEVSSQALVQSRNKIYLEAHSLMSKRKTKCRYKLRAELGYNVPIMAVSNKMYWFTWLQRHVFFS